MVAAPVAAAALQEAQEAAAQVVEDRAADRAVDPEEELRHLRLRLRHLQAAAWSGRWKRWQKRRCGHKRR